MRKFMVFCALDGVTGPFNIDDGKITPVKLFSLGTLDTVPNRLTISGIDLTANTATIKEETTGESFVYEESEPPVLVTGENYTLTIERDDGTGYNSFIKSIIPDGESEIKIVNPVIMSKLTSANLTEVTTNPEGFSSIDNNVGYKAFDYNISSVNLKDSDIILYSRRPMLLKAVDYGTSGREGNYYYLDFYGSDDKESWTKIEAEMGTRKKTYTLNGNTAKFIRYARLANDKYYNYYKIAFGGSDYTTSYGLYEFFITEAYFSE